MTIQTQLHNDSTQNIQSICLDQSLEILKRQNLRSEPDSDIIPVKPLVNNLMYLFHIEPHQDYLTFILGYGHLSRNDQALQYWVIDILESQSLKLNEVLDYLIEQLQQCLNREVC